MSANRRQDVTVEIVVGAFVFAVLLVLAMFSIAIGKSNLFRETYPLTVWFPDVGGLKDGENVLMRGLKVGIVKKIQISDSGEGGVDVLLQLDREVALHEDYRVEAVSSSMLGGMRVNLHEGTLGKPLLPAGTALRGHMPTDLMTAAGALVDDVRGALNEEGILRDLKASIANIKVITDRAVNGTGLVARLLNEDALYQEARAVIRSVDKAATDLAAITADVREGRGLLGSLLSETNNVYDTVRAIVSNANVVAENLAVVSERIERGEGTVGKLLSADDALYQDLRSAVAGLKEAAGTFERNDSTISRLFKEDKLYQEVRQLVQDARATIDDFRETSPLTTFSSIFFGAF
jgi:phospholipid/cholesterol/gamma-HCH transport system substrate-binding protein